MPYENPNNQGKRLITTLTKNGWSVVFNGTETVRDYEFRVTILSAPGEDCGGDLYVLRWNPDGISSWNRLTPAIETDASPTYDEITRSIFAPVG